MQSKRAKPFRLSYLHGKELAVGFGVSEKIVCVFRGGADETCEHCAGPKELRDDALYVVRAVDPETRRVHLVGVASPWRSDGTEIGWNPVAFISLSLLKQWHEYRRLQKEKRVARRKPRENTGEWERDPEWWKQ